MGRRYPRSRVVLGGLEMRIREYQLTAPSVRPDRQALAVGMRASWRPACLVTGGTSGVLGICAATSHALFAEGLRIELCLCASSVLCAAITATIAITALITGRSPEIRRMAALQRLARKAASPTERQSAMAGLLLDTAIAYGQVKDTAVLTEAFHARPENNTHH
jgi:hypothetical protein